MHALLARVPLAPLPAVQEAVFTGLGNEQITTDRSAVLAAAARLKKAEQDGQPVLLVLDKAAQAKNGANNLFGETAGLFAEFAQPRLKAPVRNCIVIVLPINQLAALSNAMHVPTYDLAERTTPTMVLLDSHGKQLQAIGRATPPDVMVDMLWTAINEQRYQRAQELLAQHQFKDAKRILGLVQATPIVSPLKDRARRQWEALKAGHEPAPESLAPESRAAEASIASAASR